MDRNQALSKLSEFAKRTRLEYLCIEVCKGQCCGDWCNFARGGCRRSTKTIVCSAFYCTPVLRYLKYVKKVHIDSIFKYVYELNVGPLGKDNMLIYTLPDIEHYYEDDLINYLDNYRFILDDSEIEYLMSAIKREIKHQQDLWRLKDAIF